jgi:hypothetical protein
VCHHLFTLPLSLLFVCGSSFAHIAPVANAQHTEPFLDRLAKLRLNRHWYSSDWSASSFADRVCCAPALSGGLIITTATTTANHKHGCAKDRENIQEVPSSKKNTKKVETPQNLQKKTPSIRELLEYLDAQHPERTDIAHSDTDSGDNQLRLLSAPQHHNHPGK